MKRFPMCVALNGKTVCLVGQGEQIRQKAEKLAPFGAELVYRDSFTALEAEQLPAMVIVGDTEVSKAELIYDLCCAYGIPINVVDVPRLCTFYFPALINRGDLTVSVSTGGSSPAAAGYLRKRIEELLPDDTEEILDWVGEQRTLLRERKILKEAIAAAFSVGRPLTEEELRDLTTGTTCQKRE